MTELQPIIEVELSSDLFDDDPRLEDMSASAIAVLEAYMKGYGWLDSPTKKDCLGVAAALRAAVKQAMPTVKSPWSASMNPVLTAMESRDQLLAIADELDPTTTTETTND